MTAKVLPLWQRVILVPAAALLLALLGVGLRIIFCSAVSSIPADSVPAGRTIHLVLDTTGSMLTFSPDLARLVDDRVLSRIGPGDFLDCLAVSGEVGRYNEAQNRLFTFGQPARGPEAVARRRVGDKELCRSLICDPNRAFRESLTHQTAAIAKERGEWIARVEELASHARQRKWSGYLETFRFVERNAAGAGERLIIVFGDLVHEGSRLPPPEYQGDPSQAPFDGVSVVFVRPEGTHRDERGRLGEIYWKRYFESRGANVEVFSPEHYPGLSPSPVTHAIRVARAD